MKQKVVQRLIDSLYTNLFTIHFSFSSPFSQQMKINMKLKRSSGMKGFNNLYLLLQLLLLLTIFRLSISEQIPSNYCGGTRIQTPSVHQNSSSLLSQMILCKSDKLYFRTSIGLFQISSIDYENKLLIVSHTTCSSASHFLSPHHISAGFPPPPSGSNSLILLNCSNEITRLPSVSSCNSTQLSGLCDSSSCLLVKNVDKLEKKFHPKQLNCTHYRRVYKRSEKFEVGTRVSFDIPDHVPNPCNECEKRDGNCGAGLRCVCHPQKCKDKVISVGAVVKPCRNRIVYLVFVVLMMGFLP